MPDMLVKLYDIREDGRLLDEQRARGVLIRKPIGPEKHLLVEWAGRIFGERRASELDCAFSNRPVSCFVAIANESPVGFACYDATALGYLGPMGVVESHRRQGIGKALLHAALLDMKLKGYGYAIIGWVGPVDFYTKAAGAVVIPDTDPVPGIYKTMLTREAP